MTINYERLMNIRLPDMRLTYTRRDTLLYALSIGLGQNPLNQRELPFVYEKGQRCLPTFDGTVAGQDFWLRDMDTGVDWVRLLHTEEQLQLHKPLPAATSLLCQRKVTQVVDRGEGRGALIVWERKIYEATSGDHLYTIVQSILARGNGGFGGPQVEQLEPPETPSREPDHIVDNRTSANMALLYRLNGDMNPLHVDLDVARQAGFDRPILHGLATWGIAATTVLDKVCDFDSDAIASVYGRFTAPVLPGETLRIRLWVEERSVYFTVEVLERKVMVIKNGQVGLRGNFKVAGSADPTLRLCC